MTKVIDLSFGLLLLLHRQKIFHFSSLRRASEPYGCNELTNDSDCEGAVGLIPGAVRGNVRDHLLSNGEQLGGGVHRFHLHCHLEHKTLKLKIRCDKTV